MKRQLMALLSFLAIVSVTGALAQSQPSRYEFFRDNSGNYLALSRSYPQKPHHSADGINFYPLLEQNLGINSEGLRVTLNDPLLPEKGPWTVEVKNGEMTTTEKDKTYKKVEVDLSKIAFHPFPKVRVPEFLFKIPGTADYVYVSQDKYDPRDSTFYLFVGPAAKLEQVQIDSFRRARDGGTTYIGTRLGELFWPAPSDNRRSVISESPVPKWQTKTIQSLDPNDFVIVENGNAVTLTPKK